MKKLVKLNLEVEILQLPGHGYSIKQSVLKTAILFVLLTSGYCCYSKDFNWVLKSQITVKADQYVLLSISENPSVFSIKISTENKTNTEYNSLFKRDGTEYILLPISNVDIEYKINLKHHFLSHNHKQKIVSRILNGNNDIHFYKVITKLSSLLYTGLKLKNEEALKIIDLELSKEYSSDRIYTFTYLKHLFNYNLGRYNKITSTHIQNDLIFNNKNDSIIHIQWLKSLSYLNLGKFEDAINSFKNTLDNINLKPELTTEWKLNKAEIQAYLGLSLSLNYFHRQVKTADGFYQLNTALNTAYSLDDSQLISEILYFLGSYHSAKRDWLQTLATLDVALEYIDKAKTTDNLVGIYNQKAIAHRQLNEYGQSLKYFRKAIKYIPKNDTATKANIFTNIAAIYEYLGDIDKAQRYFEHSLRVYESMGSTYGQSMVNKSLGRIYRMQNDFDKAIQFHKKSINYFKDNKENYYLETKVELSKDYYSSDNFNESKLIALTVLVLSNPSEVDSNIIQMLNTIENENYHDKFEKLFQLGYDKLFQIYTDSEIRLNQEYEFRALLVLAKISLKNSETGFVEYAIDELDNNKNMPIFDQLAFLKLKMDHYQLSNNDKYNDTVLKSLDLIHKTRSNLDVSDMALYWSNHTNILFDRHVEYLVKKKQFNKVFKALEKYSSINLREKRKFSKESNIRQRSELIKSDLNQYVKQEREAILTNNTENQLKADEAKELFLSENSNENNKISDISLDYLSIKNIQNKLKDNELLLRYYVSENTSFVYIIDKNQNSVTQISNQNKLKIEVKKVIDNLTTRKSKNILKLNNELLSHLIPSNKINLKDYNKLIIIADGILNLLPFSALSISDKSYQPLSQSDISIERTFSFSDYLTYMENISKNKKSIAAFANPIFLQNSDDKLLQDSFPKDNKLWEFSPLPYTQVEAELIDNIFPEFNFHPMYGANATNDNFLDQSSTDANIIHIATHGFFSDNSLENLGFATSISKDTDNESPGILTMRELMYTSFKANLAMISGCETTRGKHINGEGYNSLSRGLLSQGVNSVIGTIWKIPDRSTSIFVKEFYMNLKNNDGNVPLALHTTKKNFADGKFRRYRHPYYWAGFVLTSSNRNIAENIFN